MTSGKAEGMACEPLKPVFKNHYIGQPAIIECCFLKADIPFIVDFLAPLALLNHSHLTRIALLDGTGVTDNENK
jgi:hypothetical protein